MLSKLSKRGISFQWSILFTEIVHAKLKTREVFQLLEFETLNSRPINGELILVPSTFTVNIYDLL